MRLEHSEAPVEIAASLPASLQEDETVLAMLEQECEARRKATRKVNIGLWIVWSLLAAGEFWHFFRTGKLDAGFVVPMMLLIGGISIGASKSLAAAVGRAAPLRHPRSLGPMLDVLDSGNDSVRTLACDCIEDVLPRIERSDWNQLSDSRRNALSKLLQGTDRPSLAIALGDALASHGGKSAVPTLEAFCGGGTALRGSAKDKATGTVRMRLADLRMQVARELIEAEQSQAKTLE